MNIATNDGKIFSKVCDIYHAENICIYIIYSYVAKQHQSKQRLFLAIITRMFVHDDDTLDKTLKNQTTFNTLKMQSS